MFAGLAASFVVVAYAFAASDLAVARLGERIGQTAQAAMIAAGFGIAQVNLTGQHRADDAAIFDALDLANVRAFWQLDAASALKRIERVAWVDTAQITRVYPSRLDIEIKERSPVAVWSRGDARYLVDATGRVLAPLAAGEPTRLPRIAGEGANGEIGRLIAALGRHRQFATRVAMSERIAERRWRILLRNGSRIELAAEREVEGLDQIAESKFVRKALEGDAVVVDVRTPGRVAVRPLSDTPAQITQARAP